jgi:hypothetical protein
MKKSAIRLHLPLVLMLGSVWGLSEVLLGVGLKTCAQSISGSLMTGVALFFIAASWNASRTLLIPVLVVLVASAFKLFDAVLLGLPVMHGAIGNPIFAFLLEGFAFVLIVAVFRNTSWRKTSTRALLGAGSALIAVGLFPLVRFATGVPACVYGNTMIPLSIMFAPLAIAFSAFTVPLGFPAGERIRYAFDHRELLIRSTILRYMASPATLVMCLALIYLFRMIVLSDF